MHRKYCYTRFDSSMSSTTSSSTAVDVAEIEETKFLLAHVAPKLPRFYTTNIELWFIQAEHAFTACSPSITNENTKFAHVVKELPENVSQEVCDILLAPPGSTPYSDLKQELISRLGESPERRLSELLAACPLGDAKPSAKLRDITTKARQAGCADTNKIIRKVWIDSLPATTRPILAALGPSTPLELLAEAADRIRDIPTVKEAISLCPVTETKPAAPAGIETVNRRLESLEKGLTDIQQQLRTLVVQTQRSRSPSLSYNARGGTQSYYDQARSYSRGREANGANTGPQRQPTTVWSRDACWKHAQFGERAYQCAAPNWCSFSN